MGRLNRSRKRKAQMDRIKKERNAKKELLRLKKTLGLLDEHGNELIKKVEDVVEYKTPEQLKKVILAVTSIDFDTGFPNTVSFQTGKGSKRGERSATRAGR